MAINKVWQERQSVTTGSFEDYRSEFHRDRSKIIHSEHLRKLQSKTQMLRIGEHDVYRTRLTHSLEVASLSTGIANYIRNTIDQFKNLEKHDKTTILELLAEQNLFECISLVHDIGHSSFGHAGEVALNYKMITHGGFEANAQTIRVLAKLGEYSRNNGLNLTRRTLLGCTKYPTFFFDITKKKIYEKSSAPLDKQQTMMDYEPPKFNFYKEDEDVFEFVLEPLGQEDRTKFISLKHEPDFENHGRTQFKSFDSSLMELADDLSYGVYDLEDSIGYNLIGRDDWEKQYSKDQELIDNFFEHFEKDFDFSKDRLIKKLFSRTNETKHATSVLIKYFINNIKIEKLDFKEPLISYKVELSEHARGFMKVLRNIVVRKVLMRPQKQILDFKGRTIISKLFDALMTDPEKYLPVLFQYKLAHAPVARVICDYLSSLTDQQAFRLYGLFYEPFQGNIRDSI